jgi:hypothetical protein
MVSATGRRASSSDGYGPVFNGISGICFGRHFSNEVSKRYYCRLSVGFSHVKNILTEGTATRRRDAEAKA